MYSDIIASPQCNDNIFFMHSCGSVVTRPFPPPIFDHMQHGSMHVAVFCVLQAIKNWQWEWPGNEAILR